MKKLMATLCLMVLLGGCVSLLPDSGDLEPRIRLDANAPVISADTMLETSLVISDPSAEAVYNTYNLAVATGPYRFEYLDGAEWADRVPVLFRIYLERRFENSGGFQAVGDRTELPIGAGYVLYTDIREFHLDQSRGQELALVSFSARLTDSRGKTLGTEVFAAESRTNRNGQRDIAYALNEAARISSEEAVIWANRLVTGDYDQSK